MVPKSSSPGLLRRALRLLLAPPPWWPTTEHAAAALRSTRFQTANSSPRFLSLPVDEIATRRKAQASISPPNCLRGRIDPSAPKAGSRSIQNSNSLQSPASSRIQPVLALLPWNNIPYPLPFLAHILSAAKSGCATPPLPPPSSRGATCLGR